ncbi:gas vesicle protein GvpJ [Promicromonospora sp. NPDC057138]|uniref:gas vesicle protein GvpJ n=1 Tax=Promicromonospora sp. NPDC057138 TaxID=3346031 RepID=UPI003637069B
MAENVMTARSGPERDSRSAMEPTRDLRVTLPDLLDVLLDKGVYLDLDLIVTVADIPLIGVSLRAMVGGIETMLEHGMMRAWDEQTREWVRRSLARRVPLADDEDVIARMAGGHRQEEPYVTWRPGTVYLTTRRLMVWRAEPRELLWQATLDEITGVGTQAELSAGGEERTRVALTTRAGTTLLSAAAPESLVAQLREHAPGSGAPVPARRPAPFQALVWYREDLAGGSVWRGGTGTLDRTNGLTWKGVRDVRPAVRLRPDQIRSVDLVRGRTPVGRQMLVVRGDSTTVRLATKDTTGWATALSKVSDARTQSRTGGQT